MKKGTKSTKKNKKNKPALSLPTLIAQFAHSTAQLLNAYHQHQACPHCRMFFQIYTQWLGRREGVSIPPTNDSSLDSMDDLLTAMDSETTGMNEWDGFNGFNGFDGFDPNPFIEENDDDHDDDNDNEEESMNSE